MIAAQPSAGPRYWTYSAAKAAAVTSAYATGRTYYIFECRADGAFAVSAHAEPAPGDTLLEEVAP